jgi:hypothetical protein
MVTIFNLGVLADASTIRRSVEPDIRSVGFGSPADGEAEI